MAAFKKTLTARKRAHPLRLIIAGAIFAFGSLATITLKYFHDLYSNPDALTLNQGIINSHNDFTSGHHSRQLLAVQSNSSGGNVSKEYPNDLFSDEELKQGAFLLYIVGVIYMFIALAIVCDEFFVPSLEVITQTLLISQDVAGATFMAAGGSAPELFTSFIGVFIAHSAVGIGTIVGSAVFNILFVIGMCAIFSTQVLALTWWPLFRDVTFYSVSLICLMNFFFDAKIYWWESLILLSCYALYVIFMKFNVHIERWVKTKCLRNRVNNSQPISEDDATSTPEPSHGCTPDGGGGLHYSNSMPILKSGSGKFRHGVLQLMIHTIDPISEDNVEDQAVKLHAIASLKVVVNAENHNNLETIDHNHPTSNGHNSTSNGHANLSEVNSERHASQTTTITTVSNSIDAGATSNGSQDGVMSQSITLGNGTAAGTSAMLNGGDKAPHSSVSQDQDKQRSLEMEDPEPLSLKWPATCAKRVTYVLVAPLVFPMWVTLPDVRKASSRNWYPVTFIGSILWIAIFSYLMNWWAATIGRTIGIKEPVMGLTFLAAGTSIPDLITSVIVAKKGYGDMAVSSSVGSNIFDVTVGLPLPWLLYGLINSKPYEVDSTGLFCSIALLFLMLMLVIVMIASFKWRMNKWMGGFCLLFYLVFLAISLLLEYDIIPCPVNA